MSERAQQNERLRVAVEAILQPSNVANRAQILGTLSAALRAEREPQDPGTWARELRQRRKAAGRTQSEIARLLDVAQSTIANWEAGKTPAPCAPTQRRVLQYLTEAANA